MPKILVIRFRRVGDAVLTTSICSALKKNIPNAEVHYVLNDGIAPLFENHPDIDKIITFSYEETHSFLTYLRKIRKLMKAEKYDIIIDVRSTINTIFFALFSLKSKYRIGVKKVYTKFIYNYRVEPNKIGRDYVNNQYALLNPLEKEFGIKHNETFSIYCDEKEKTSFRQYMESKGIDFSKPIIFCTVATRLEYKRWPKDDMKAIVKKLIEEYDAQLIFNYQPGQEFDFAYSIFKELDCNPNIFMDIEAKGLIELVALISNSDFMFGNEGGPRHMAQALDVPSFAVFPPGVSMNRWLPNRSDRFNGIQPDEINPELGNDPKASYKEKFDIVNADVVWEKLKPMLDLWLKK